VGLSAQQVEWYAGASAPAYHATHKGAEYGFARQIFDMNRRAELSAFAALTAFPVVSALAQTPAADPLPSWNDTATKNSIVTFVERVTKQDSPDLVPPAPARFLQLSECIFFERAETSVALAKRNQKWGIPLGQPGARIV
jgi:hypothetical protein